MTGGVFSFVAMKIEEQIPFRKLLAENYDDIEKYSSVERMCKHAKAKNLEKQIINEYLNLRRKGERDVDYACSKALEKYGMGEYYGL